MPEGHNGGFEKGHRPQSGELQARAAEKIITEAQKPRKSELASEARVNAFPATRHENADTARMEAVRSHILGEANPHDTKTYYIKNSSDVDKVFDEIKKNSDKNIAQRINESRAKINTFMRLPALHKLSMLLTGTVVDQELYDQILAEEKKKLGV
jgi:hypothetical protein